MQTIVGLRIRDGEVEEFDPKGWTRHPAVSMWRGSLHALVAYQRAICFEWRNNRGYKDTCLDKTIMVAGTVGGDGVVLPGSVFAPWWLGSEKFHASHRSNLLRKNPNHYGVFWPEEDADQPYLWPQAVDTFKIG